MKQEYKKIAIIGLVAAFTLQVIWLYQSFTFTSNEMRIRASEALSKAMFAEAEIRACKARQSIEISDVNSPVPDIGKFEEELFRKTLTKPNKAIIDSLLHKSEIQNFIICLYGGEQHDAEISINRYFTFKSDTIFIREDRSEGIFLLLGNPFRLFFERMGLTIVANVLILSVVFFCIVRQIAIIRIQQRDMQERRDISYALMHNMKTPLCSISVGIYSLSKLKNGCNSVVKEKLQMVLAEEALRLQKLIDRMLMIWKMEEGKFFLRKEMVELKHIVENLEETFAIKATKPLNFINHMEAELVYADKEVLIEIISCLIDNAIKYSKDRIEIGISSKTMSGGINICIKDNGIGISKHDQTTIFGKFERASASRKRGIAGFGLGLNYVWKAVEAHDGTVIVASEPDRYTAVTIFLPDEKGTLII